MFLYESLAQLAFVYPARRILERPEPNRVLNLIVLGSVALQAATIAFGRLRTMLGLVVPSPAVWGLVAGALLVTVTGAEIWTRSVARRGEAE